MSKEKNEKVESVKAEKFSKSAFVESVAGSTDGLLAEVLLKDGKSYTKEEVANIVKDWKAKPLKGADA